jgi:hypothetical protein
VSARASELIKRCGRRWLVAGFALERSEVKNGRLK